MIRARSGLLLSWAVTAVGCTSASDAPGASGPAHVAWRAPSRLGGGCSGGKPDQGGVSYEAIEQGHGYVLQVSLDPWIDDDPPGVESYPLTAEEWTELVELAREGDLWNWRPEARSRVHCVSCFVAIDDHRVSYCGALTGPDRGAALRGKLTALARRRAEDAAREAP